MGHQAAQLIHAAGASSPGNLPVGTYAIALHAKDEDELKRINYALLQEGIGCSTIIESDAPYSGQLMAIGIAPMDRRRLRRLLSRYPLVK